MEQAPETVSPVQPMPLSGRKVYSPAALAGYSAFVCLPFGYILYGLNIKARGQRQLGLSWVFFGAACIAFMLFMPPRFGAISSIAFGSGVFGGIALFQHEGRSFTTATAQGAARARWWPPALIVLALIALYLVTGWLLEAVA